MVSAVFINSWAHEQKVFKFHVPEWHPAQWEQHPKDPASGKLGAFVRFLVALTLDLKNRFNQQRVMIFAVTSQET